MVATLADLIWFLGLCIFSLLLLLFPSGQYLSPRWRVINLAVWLAFLAGVLTHWASPQVRGVVPVTNPYSLGSIGQVAVWIENIGIAVVFAAIFLSILSLVLRFIRSKGIERLQMKWFAFGTVTFGILLVTELTLPELPGSWEAIKEAIMFIIFPVTIGIAILRYKLFDIDWIIRRTLVYGALTLMLTLIFFISVTLLQFLFSKFSGQESQLAIVLSTLVIATLFNPFRRRLQGFIDRRFYRQKYNAENVLAAFAAAARVEADLETLTHELILVAQETIQPETITLWLTVSPRDKG